MPWDIPSRLISPASLSSGIPPAPVEVATAIPWSSVFGVGTSTVSSDGGGRLDTVSRHPASSVLGQIWMVGVVHSMVVVRIINRRSRRLRGSSRRYVSALCHVAGHIFILKRGVWRFREDYLARLWRRGHRLVVRPLLRLLKMAYRLRYRSMRHLLLFQNLSGRIFSIFGIRTTFAYPKTNSQTADSHALFRGDRSVRAYHAF